MSKITDFLIGLGTDDKGRTLDEILYWPDARLEYSHDVIQWLFPLEERSQYNYDAPVLTVLDVAVIQSNPEIKANILRAYDRFTKFYDNPQWLTPGNHNYLRLTRILKCLGLAGLDKEKDILKKVLNALYIQHSKVIGATTKKYWDEA
jgi:hypothetical protein